MKKAISVNADMMLQEERCLSSQRVYMCTPRLPSFSRRALVADQIPKERRRKADTGSVGGAITCQQQTLPGHQGATALSIPPPSVPPRSWRAFARPVETARMHPANGEKNDGSCPHLVAMLMKWPIS